MFGISLSKTLKKLDFLHEEKQDKKAVYIKKEIAYPVLQKLRAYFFY
jgi:hypothetical protein